MDFQHIPKVEKHDFYIDLAFKRTKLKAVHFRDTKLKKFSSRIDASKKIELMKLSIIRDTLVEKMNHIVKGFPNFENLDDFYQELLRDCLDYVALKKSLGAVDWSIKKISEFYKVYSRKINRTKELRFINQHRREYYGRVSSVLKQIKKELEYLEESRKILRTFPDIKPDMFTVCLAGFPNVGKSTLLSKLTSSKPEINAYPFTTKSLNLGYMQDSYRKIQLIDTPGTLNRFNKMNLIEKQAYLAIKHLADCVVFVFDLTFEYPLEDQKKLFLKMKKMGKPMLVYLSKTDLIDKKVIDDFSFSPYLDFKELEKELWIRQKKNK